MADPSRFTLHVSEKTVRALVRRGFHLDTDAQIIAALAILDQEEAEAATTAKADPARRYFSDEG